MALYILLFMIMKQVCNLTLLQCIEANFLLATCFNAAMLYRLQSQIVHI